MPKNLIVAYAVTVAIHVGYIAHLVRRYQQTRRATPVPSAAAKANLTGNR